MRFYKQDNGFYLYCYPGQTEAFKNFCHDKIGGFIRCNGNCKMQDWLGGVNYSCREKLPYLELRGGTFLFLGNEE